MELSKTTPDILPDIQLRKCRSTIGMALVEYSPGTTTHSSSGVLYVIYGEYMWIYLGFTPCASVRATLKKEYSAIFGKITPVELDSKSVQPSTQEGTAGHGPSKDLGFAYGSPFVGIPLPR